MKTKTRTQKKIRGQATIELIMTLFLFITVFFMYVQCSLGFAVSNYVQYATYMGARAYQAAAGSSGEQNTHATNYLQAMLGTGKGRFASILKGQGDPFIGPAAGRVGPGNRLNNWQVGVTYTFTANLFLAPLIPGVNTNSGKVTLQSQSWLGQEPNAADCVRVLSTQTRTPANIVPGGPIYDNGC